MTSLIPLPNHTDKYQYLEFLGSGSYSIVWKARNKETGETVAIKRIPESKIGNNKEQFGREIKLQLALQHENLVKLYEYFITDEGGEEISQSTTSGSSSSSSSPYYTKETTRNPYRSYGERVHNLVLELIQGQDIHKAITQYKRPFDEKLTQRFARMIAEGLKYLDEMNIAHRDLKPANLLLSTNDLRAAVVKICDFGMAKELEQNELTQTVAGTPYYLAPEIAAHTPYGRSADMWSFGAILFEMMAGSPPIPAEGLVDLFHKLTSPSLAVDFHPLVRAGVSPLAISLVKGLLTPKPAERLTVYQVLAHPWLAPPPESRLNAFVASGRHDPTKSSTFPPSFAPHEPLPTSSVHAIPVRPALGVHTQSDPGIMKHSPSPKLTSDGHPSPTYFYTTPSSLTSTSNSSTSSSSSTTSSPSSSLLTSTFNLPHQTFDSFRPQEYFPTLESSYDRALALIDVAAACVNENQLYEALTLFVTALGLLETILVSLPSSVASASLGEKTRITKFEILTKADSLYRIFLSTVPPEARSASRVGQLHQKIFTVAMGLGRTGAISEEMGLTEQAIPQYQKAITLLNHLILVAPDQHSLQLRDLISRFAQRLKELTQH